MLKRIAFAALAATLAAALRPAPAAAQKALVYCPVTIDGTGCNRIVDALVNRFPDGVDRGYDGSNGTIDLHKADLQHYSVVVVPSLADNDKSQPYALLRDVATRFKMAINGRVAVYAGAADQGQANREAKNSLITNLATWASGGHKYKTGLVGLVAFLDLSSDAAARYSWLRAMSPADVSADADLQTFGAVDATSDGAAVLSSGGSAIKYGNMASLGLHIGKQGAVHTRAAATAGANKSAVLVKYSLTPDVSNDGASFSRAKVGGASFSSSSSDASSATTGGPTLTTDKPDYLPGDTVTFTGTGFAPNDTLVITLHEDPSWIDPDRTVTAVADASGNFTNHTFVVDQHDFGVTFTATAVGSPSGLTTQMTFTDGNASLTLKLATVGTALTAAQVPTFTWQVPWHLFTGNGGNPNTDCSGTPTDNSTTLTGNTASGSPAGSDNVSFRIDVPVATGAFAGQYVFDYWSTTDTATPVAAPGCINGPKTGNDQFTYFAHFKASTLATTTTPAVTSATFGATDQAVSLSATVSGGTVNVGTVKFTLKDGNGVVVGTAVTSGTVSSGAASVSYTIPGGTAVASNYSILAEYSGGAGFASSSGTAQFSILQASQTITFGTLANKTFGDPQFTVSATASSGLTVSFTLSGTSKGCSLAGTVVTITGATAPGESCSIVASQGGNTNYQAATSVTQSFTIAKASQTISFSALPGRTFGDPPFTVSATASSGLAVGFALDAASKGCSLAGSTVTITAASGPAETCAIVASQAGDNNYLAAVNVTQGFTIAKATQTITFGPLTNKTYGDAPFSVTATSSSALPVSFDLGASSKGCSVSAGTVTLTGATATGESCTIVASQAGNGNYQAATSVSQSFTIAKFTPTVSAMGGTFTFNGNPQGGSGSATGIGGASLTPVVVSYQGTGATTYGPAATAPTDAGSYTVTASYAGDANYNSANSTPASLVINPAAQTITFGALSSKTFGDPNFSLTATASSGLTVSFALSASSKGCSLSGSTVTITGATAAGEMCSIVASQPGNGNYSAATPVTQGFTIAKAATVTTVTASNATYDGNTHGATANVTGPAGLNAPVTPINYVGRNGTTYATSTTAPTHAGDYTASATYAGSANYVTSSDSKDYSIAKANQTITFGGLANKTFGDPNVTLGATASSGLAVSYALDAASKGCSVSASAVMITGATAAGEACIIIASQAGDGDYNAAAPVTQSFTIAKAATVTTVTASNATYDGGTHGATANVTGPAGLNAPVLPINYSGRNATVYSSTTAPTHAGDYTASATYPGTANYLTSSDNKDYSIAKANQSISFSALSNKTFGDPSVTLGATASSGLAVTYALDPASKGCSVSGNSVTIVAATAVGESCIIVASQAGNGDYNAATPVTQSFTIAKADPTIDVQGYSGIYDGNAHGASGTAKGTKGETLSGLSLGATFTNVPGGMATWTFTDVTGNYNNKSASVAIVISPFTPTIDWNDPAAVDQGTQLSNTQLNAIVRGVGGMNINSLGTLTYTPSAGTTLFAVGSTNLSASFAASAGGNYANAPAKTVSIQVNNVLPVVAPIVLPADPTPITQAVSISTSFTDPGLQYDGPYAVVVNWGKDPTTGVSILTTLPSVTTPGPITASHKYTVPGIYTITVTVTDKNGGVGSSMTSSYVVVYDPSGGFVTGGGWITADAGSCVAGNAPAGVCTAATGGRANFGFVSKYEKGANVPTGNTEFQFQAGNLNFKSTVYQWLVVSGARAQYKGSGTINGQPGFDFILTAIDGTLPGGNNQDRFRIKITYNGNVVFDNQNGSLDSDALAGASTALGGGNISIKAK